MAKIYWNIVDDEVGVSENGRVIIISSGKDYLSNGFKSSKLDLLDVDLVEELECIYTWDDDVDERQVRYEFGVNSEVFEESLELKLEEDGEETTKSSEEVVVNKKIIASCDICGSDYTEDDIRAMEYSDADGGYICPECDEILTMDKLPEIVVEEVENVEVEGIVEEDDDEEAASTIPGTTSTSTPVAATTPSASISRATIKDWKDLNTPQIMYSFLKNYFTLMGDIQSTIITKTDGVPSKEFFNILVDNGICSKEFVDDKINKVYVTTLRINSRENGSLDGIADAVVIANACNEAVLKAIDTVYVSNTEKYNNLYTYWMALLGASDVKYAKIMMKNAMAVVTKKFKKADDLFEFNLEEIPNEVVDFKVNEGSTSSIEGISSVVGSTTPTVWSLVRVPIGEIAGIPCFEKKILLETTDGSLISESLLELLEIRGVDTTIIPLLPVPKTCRTREAVRSLLAGIENLSEK